MEEILDEHLKKEKVLEPIPIVIYTLIASIFIYLIGVVLRFQSWPYGYETRAIGHICILITGIGSLKVFMDCKDSFLKFYSFLFLFGGLSTVLKYVVFIDYPLRGILNLGGSFFMIGVFLTLSRYFTLRRPQKKSLSIISFPLLITSPIITAGILFKIQSWPYGSELITIAAFVFFFGTIIMLFFRLSLEAPELRQVTVWLVLMANIMAFGALFKIQSWPYAAELLLISFLGGALGVMYKLTKQQKMLKQQQQE